MKKQNRKKERKVTVEEKLRQPRARTMGLGWGTKMVRCAGSQPSPATQ